MRNSLIYLNHIKTKQPKAAYEKGKKEIAVQANTEEESCEGGSSGISTEFGPEIPALAQDQLPRMGRKN